MRADPLRKVDEELAYTLAVVLERHTVVNCATADKSFGGDPPQSPSKWKRTDALYHGLDIQAQTMNRPAHSTVETPSPEARIDDLLATATTGFSCKMCGSCCALDVRITESDLMRIESRFPAQAARVSRVREQGQAEGGLYSTLFTDPSGRIHCIFLEGNKCSVHEAKPLQCRMYPFFPIQVGAVQNLVSGCDGLVLTTSPTGERYVMSIDQDCAGVQTSSSKPNWQDIVLLWEQNERESE